MPDAAFAATERQFLGLLDAGSGCETVELSRYTMEGVPRGERIRARIAADYSLRGHHLGPAGPADRHRIEPARAPHRGRALLGRPARAALVGGRDVPAMLLSCLSAHAALAVFDGLERTTLPAKCTGVFPQEVDPTHPLAAGSRSRRPAALAAQHRGRRRGVAAGYEVALQSEGVGWSVVTKTVGGLRSYSSRPSRVRSLQPGARVRGTSGDTPASATKSLPPPGLRDGRGLGRGAPAASAHRGRRAGPGVGRISVRRGGARAPWPWRGAPSVCTPTCWAPSEGNPEEE